MPVTAAFAWRGPMRLTANDLITCFRPSRCELRLYLRHRGEQEAEPGPYQQVIRRLGEMHERRHLQTFPDFLDLSSVTEQERLLQTRAAIDGNVPVIYQGGLRSEFAFIDGEAEVIGVPDFLIRTASGYAIRDAKMARRINEQDHPEILLQLSLYGWLLESTIGSPPDALEVYSGTGDVVPVAYEPHRILAWLEDAMSITTAASEPYSAVGWTKCGDCGFHGRCWTQAVERHDVAVVRGVDQSLARALADVGVRTRAELVGRFRETTLSEFRRRCGGRMRRVGRRAAANILRNAAALDDNRELMLRRPRIPAGPNYVMFDVEGLPPQLDELDKIYLWGMQVFGEHACEYTAALAGFGADGDRDGWKDFLANARRVFEQYGDLPFVHWSGYEKDRIKRYRERFGDPDGIAARITQNLRDLLRITESAVVLPLPSYSLKVVEKYVGYRRSLEEFGAEGSMAKYIEATETKDEAARAGIMQQILAYNREDLEATWAVLQWLKALAKRGQPELQGADPPSGTIDQQ